MVVAEVDPDGAAADKGLKKGDVILEVAGKPVSRPSDVVSRSTPPRTMARKSVLLRVKSDDGEHFWRCQRARLEIPGVPPVAGRRNEMDGRDYGLVPGPAHSALFRPVGGRTYPRPRDSGKVAAGPIKPPEDLPPFLFGLSARDSLYV